MSQEVPNIHQYYQLSQLDKTKQIQKRQMANFILDCAKKDLKMPFYEGMKDKFLQAFFFK